MKKVIGLLAVGSFLTLQSCGTIFKNSQAGAPHSSKLDITIVVLDSLGLLLFLIPGIVAFTVDYLNGTLFLPYGHTAHLKDTSPETIQKVLAQHGIKVSLDQLKKAKALQLAATR